MTRVRRLARVIITGLAVSMLLLAAAAATERVVWRGKVLPGVQLVGASVSGKPADAVTDEVTRVAAHLEREPVAVRAGDVGLELDPRRIELRIDSPSTASALQDAGRSGNPLAQVVGTLIRLTRPDEVMWHVTYDAEAFEEVLDEWEQAVARNAVDGSLRFVDGEVVPVDPLPGRVLVRPATDQIIVGALRSGERNGITVPVRTLTPQIARDEVARAAEEARTLLAEPVTVRLEDLTVRLEPRQIGAALRTEPRGSRLRLTVDNEVLREELGPDAAARERLPEDARFVVEGTRVRVVPHVVGKQLDLDHLATAILRGERLIHGRLSEREPEATTESLGALGITELVSSFRTDYPAGQPRVQNIHRAADLVDNAIVRPDHVYSLNEAIGQRTPDRGFVSAPVIYAGEFTEDVGGGVSQFATTFFNAVFFGGYPIVEYQPHTFYITRYPMGREATISWPSPDLRFKNDTEYAILIRTSVSSSSVTVNFYSTKTRNVEALGPEVLETIATPVQYLADANVARGEEDVREQGTEGRVVRVVRVVRKLDGEEVGRRVFTTRYRPERRVVAVHPCDHPDEEKRPPPEECEIPDEEDPDDPPPDDDPNGGDSENGNEAGATRAPGNDE